MRAHAGFNRRLRASVGAVAAIVTVIITPISEVAFPSAQARPKPFDSNGKDDSYAIAMSRDKVH